MAAPTKGDKTRAAAELRELKELAAQAQGERHTGATPANRTALRTGTPHAPAETARARRGEDIMSSRGYQYMRMIGVTSNEKFPRSQAKIELDLAERMEKSFYDAAKINPSRGGYWVPFSMDHLPEDYLPADMRYETRMLIKAGSFGATPDEMQWLSQKAVTGGMSYQDATAGGTLVGPPGFGDLIELFRNKAAVTEAGATIVQLPPTGAIQYPRQVGVTTGYWLGENTDGTKSYPETGLLTLRAKKCVSYVVMPNDLLRYNTASAEQLVRNDMTKTLALTADLAYLNGEGGNLKPEGLLNTTGTATVTPGTVHADGDTLAPQDLYKFLAGVELNNAELTAFVMRPDLFYLFPSARAGVWNGSAIVAQGQFVYDQFRGMGDKVEKTIGGFKCVTSNNVPKTIVKGTGTTLTCVIGGMWPDYYVGMFGALEFAQTDQGHTLLLADQCAIRGIMITDGGARHPGAFAIASSLLTAIGV